MGNEVKEIHLSSEANQEDIFTTKLDQKRSDIKPPKLEKFEPKAGKARLGDKITALHGLVSPLGKADTASVLLETISYIKFLLGQVEALSTLEHHDSVSLSEVSTQTWLYKLFYCFMIKGFGTLRSRGLCVVPIMKVTDQESNSANRSVPLAELLESINGRNKEAPRGLDDEVTNLQPHLPISSKVDIKSPELAVTKHVCDGLTIDIRHVNDANDIGGSCIGKHSANIAKYQALMNFLVVALILVMLIMFYLQSGPCHVMGNYRLLKLLKAYALPYNP